jgi:predicted metalloprotease with PDZ domain
MGDRILFEAGVFDEAQYNKEILNYILRHFHNDGRLHYSVADSSFDTWLDGYVQGVPGRKSSIYVEGCLVAYMCDMRIRKATDNKKSLHDVMLKMYELTNQRVGYTDTIYQETLELVGGVSFQDIFEKYIHGTENFWEALKEAFSFEAKELCKEVSLSKLHQIGIKGSYAHGAYEVKQVLENSSAYKDGVVEGDFIHGINGFSIVNDLDHWLKYFQEDEIAIQVKRNGQLKNVQLSMPNDFQFYNYLLK